MVLVITITAFSNKLHAALEKLQLVLIWIYIVTIACVMIILYLGTGFHSKQKMLATTCTVFFNDYACSHYYCRLQPIALPLYCMILVFMTMS